MPQKGIDGELLLAVGAGELWRVLAILWTNHDRQRPGRRAAQPAAIDLQVFCEARLENSLRCLVCRGYVKHRLPRGERRISPPPVPTCSVDEFSPRSRFSITPSGRAVARQLNQLLGELGFAAEAVRPTSATDSAAAAASSGRIMPLVQPRFDAGPRALCFGGTVLRQFRRSAHNQIAMLAAFERANWPRRIADPLPHHGTADPGERLRAAVHGLNGSQRPPTIRFFCDGTGEGICWEFATISGVEAVMVLDLLSRKPSQKLSRELS